MTQRQSATQYGEILPADALIMQVDRGDAKDENDTVVYKLSTTMTGSPIVTSKQTDKRFKLGWHEIVKMAVDAGIDEEAGS